VIATFRSKALKVFWARKDASKLAADQVERIRRRLGVLDSSSVPGDMAVPGLFLGLTFIR
jgi:plasmid maintenance system killer protein